MGQWSNKRYGFYFYLICFFQTPQFVLIEPLRIHVATHCILASWNHLLATANITNKYEMEINNEGSKA